MNNAQMNPNQPLTIAQAAKEYGFPEYCIRTLVKRGEFPVIQSGNRCYITRKIFENYLETGGKTFQHGC